MKQTILFSNVVGSIYSDKTTDCEFNPNLQKVLKQSIKPNSNLVFINAPGFINDNLYFSKIINCFEKANIHFDNTIELSDNTKVKQFENFEKQNRVYFLMGGNPITQLELIKFYNLEQTLKNYDGIVIGFCAGAINLSKYSIITSDGDFEKPFWYNGLNRIEISIEPHFDYDDTDFTKNRINEINTFCKQLDTNIYAIPDKSVINIKQDIEYLGEIYKF